jgi:hypothetical protein
MNPCAHANAEASALRRARCLPPQVVEQIAEIHMAWKTDGEIGEAVGVRAKVIWYAGREWGINRHKPAQEHGNWVGR